MPSLDQEPMVPTVLGRLTLPQGGIKAAGTGGRERGSLDPQVKEQETAEGLGL